MVSSSAFVSFFFFALIESFFKVATISLLDSFVKASNFWIDWCKPISKKKIIETVK